MARALPDPRTVILAKQINEIALRKGYSQNKLAAAAGVAPQQWSALLGGNARGETQGGSRLTAAQVLAMRRVRKDGDSSFTELAAVFGVHKNTAHRVATGRSWRHLPMPGGDT